MANDKDLKVGIQTTADVSGAEEVKASLAEIERVTQEAAAASTKAGDDQEAAAARLATELRKLEDQVRETAAASEKGFSGMLDAPKVDKVTDAHADLTEQLQKEKAAFFAVEDAATKAARAADVAEASARKAKRDATGGLLGVDVSKGAEDLAERAAEAAGFGREFSVLRSLVSADAIAIGGSIAGIGAAAVASYKALSTTVDGYKQLMAEAKASGDSLGPEIEDQVAALEASLAPFKGAIDAIAGAWDSTITFFKDPVGELNGLNDLKASIDRAKESAERLKQARQKIATDNQTDLKGIYDKEVASLKEQEAALSRILGLRSTLRGLEAQGLSTETESAKLRGGDVLLAQANELAASLQAGIEQLSGKLREAQASEATARREVDAALVRYQQGLTDKIDPATSAALAKAVDDAQAALALAKEKVGSSQLEFNTAQRNLRAKVEQELATLETSTTTAISKEAKKVLDGIYSAIQTDYSQVPVQAIAAIQVQAGTITTAATEKANQVQTALGTERTNTAAAIQNLAPKQQDTQAIVAAVKSVGTAQATQGNAIISALSNLGNSIAALTQRVNGQDQRIAQLFQRIR